MFVLHSNYGASSKVFTFNKLLIFLLQLLQLLQFISTCVQIAKRNLYIYINIYIKTLLSGEIWP